MKALLHHGLVAATLLCGAARAQGETVEELLRRSSELQRSDPAAAIALAERAIEAAGFDRAAQLDAQIKLGLGHLFAGEYARALAANTRALELAVELGDAQTTADAHNNIGIVHYYWGEHERALEHYSKALEIRRAFPEVEKLAASLNNLGNVYYAAGRHEQAVAYGREALALYEESGPPDRVANTLNNIGLALLRLGERDSARGHFDRALEIAREAGASAEVAFSLNNLGVLVTELGHDADARRYYEQALELREQIGDEPGIAIGLKNVGVAAFQAGDHEGALRSLERALALAQELGVAEIERDVWDALSSMFAAGGDHRRALEAHRRFKVVSDRLFQDATSRRLADMRALYEVEKKDRELAQLRTDREVESIVRWVALGGALVLGVLVALLYNRNRLVARANREMRRAHEATLRAQAEHEKAMRAELAHAERFATQGELTAALAHELGKPMSAILLDAQTTQQLIATRRSDPQIDEALADIVAGAGRARDLIQRLRNLIRRGEVDARSVDVGDLLRDLRTVLREDARTRGRELVFEVAPGLPRALGDAVQIKQVVSNLIHNAVAASDGGAVTVRADLSDDDEVRVSVTDTGPGPDDDTFARMFDPFFTTKPDGMGMGLRICKTIVEAHGGRISADRNPDRGLTVWFTLPAVARRVGAREHRPSNGS